MWWLHTDTKLNIIRSHILTTRFDYAMIHMICTNSSRTNSIATKTTSTTPQSQDNMSSCKCIPPIPVLTYIANGIDTSQTEKSISIADQEAFYDEVMYGESSKSLVNRYDQEAFYEEIIRIEQVPLKDNDHTPHELFAMNRRKERQHEKLVNDAILQKKKRQSRVSISRLLQLHSSRLQGLIDYVRLRHVSLERYKKKSNKKQQQMKRMSFRRGSTVDLEEDKEDNMFLVLDTSWVDLRAY